jgi:hypothetical protein
MTLCFRLERAVFARIAILISLLGLMVGCEPKPDATIGVSSTAALPPQSPVGPTSAEFAEIEEVDAQLASIRPALGYYLADLTGIMQRWELCGIGSVEGQPILELMLERDGFDEATRALLRRKFEFSLRQQKADLQMWRTSGSLHAMLYGECEGWRIESSRGWLARHSLRPGNSDVPGLPADADSMLSPAEDTEWRDLQSELLEARFNLGQAVDQIENAHGLILLCTGAEFDTRPAVEGVLAQAALKLADRTNFDLLLEDDAVPAPALNKARRYVHLKQKDNRRDVRVWREVRILEKMQAAYCEPATVASAREQMASYAAMQIR